jgi:putative heme iron utilization protein
MPDPRSSPTPEQIEAEFRGLVDSLRIGVLITMGEGGPFGSHVPFLMDGDWTGAVIHISQLAVHTQNLARDRRIALFLAEPDSPEKNPTALKRINLQGTAHPMAPGTAAYDEARERYLRRFPQSAVTFQLPDFQLWALEMTRVHFVSGFGRAFHATADSSARWMHLGR